MHLIPNKIQKLKEKWHTLDPLQRETRPNRIDEQATSCLISAEKRCPKFRTSEVDYSLETKKAKKTWY